MGAKPTTMLNAIGARLLLTVRDGSGILMELFTNPAGYMDKDGMLKDGKEMSYLENVEEDQAMSVRRGSVMWTANKNK